MSFLLCKILREREGGDSWSVVVLVYVHCFDNAGRSIELTLFTGHFIIDIELSIIHTPIFTPNMVKQYSQKLNET